MANQALQQTGDRITVFRGLKSSQRPRLLSCVVSCRHMTGVDSTKSATRWGPSRWILTLGFIVSAYMLIVGASYLFADGISEIWPRVADVIVAAGVATLPYAILATAARRTCFARAALTAAIPMFGLDAIMRTSAIFYSDSSTDALVLIFLPFWLTVFAAVIRVVFAMVKSRRLPITGRDS